MDLARLTAIIELFGSASLSELTLTEGDVRVRIKASRRPAPAGSIVRPQTGRESPVPARAVNVRSIVRAPLSGTFFAAPSPSAPAFYKIGDRVTEDSVLCIIEAMKTMTHVPSGYDGTLQDVLVENGAAVEFGQPLFEIA